jgi:hypothetical protein
MTLFLSESDVEQLERIGEKYQYAQLLWNLALPTDTRGCFTVDRADAWEWKDVVDRDKGFLPLSQGKLRQKLIAFYERIQ